MKSNQHAVYKLRLYGYGGKYYGTCDCGSGETYEIIRRAKALGISVLGIFAGNFEDVPAEKKIFGKDFAYIRDISNFSHIVGVYLRRQLEED